MQLFLKHCTHKQGAFTHYSYIESFDLSDHLLHIIHARSFAC